MTAGNEYSNGGEGGAGGAGSNMHRGSQRNIQIGKQTERAVSLVTQHRLNQTQGISSNLVTNGNQFSQTGLMRHKAASNGPKVGVPSKQAQGNLSGI